MIKKRIIILIVLIAALLATYVGITYATFTSSAIQTNENIITTTNCLNITFQSVNSPLNLTNSYPMKDEVAQNKTPYTFTITNGCSHYLTVDLGFEIASTSTLTSNQVKATISRTGTLSMPDLLSNRSSAAPIREGEEARTLYTDDLLPNESKTYDFRMWLNYDEIATNVVGKGMSGTVIVAGTIKKDNTLRGAIMTNSDNFLTGDAQSVYTNPGQQTATVFEGLRTAPDDYGITYYYRGAVENNYVVFAKMCWRIVRVDGKGNIKLVLYNYNSDKDNVTNPCNVTGNDLAFARDTSGTKITQSFSIDSNTIDKNAYLGFMYGDPVTNKGSMTDIEAYDQEHANKYKSGVLTSLETWYRNNLGDLATTNYTSYLADVIWCNDKSLATTKVAGETSYKNLGYNQVKTFYGPAERLLSTSDWTKTTTSGPTFKCPDASGSDKDLSRFTLTTSAEGNKKLTYSIGLLTADEVAYAGATYKDSNTSYYLNKNANSTVWWTMSPFHFHISDARVFRLLSSGSLDSGYVGTSYCLRPSVSLKSTVSINSGGTGTSSNPFVVK